MVGALVLTLGWLLIIGEVIWYFTCTEHEEVPLLFVLIGIIFSLIPGLNIIMCIGLLIALAYMIDEDIINLKNNWFNKKFLAYHE